MKKKKDVLSVTSWKKKKIKERIVSKMILLSPSYLLPPPSFHYLDHARSASSLEVTKDGWEKNWRLFSGFPERISQKLGSPTIFICT